MFNYQPQTLCGIKDWSIFVPFSNGLDLYGSFSLDCFNINKILFDKRWSRLNLPFFLDLWSGLFKIRLHRDHMKSVLLKVWIWMVGFQIPTVVWISNGQKEVGLLMVQFFEWDPKTKPFKIRTKGFHFVRNHLKSVQKHPDSESSCYQMVCFLNGWELGLWL